MNNKINIYIFIVSVSWVIALPVSPVVKYPLNYEIITPEDKINSKINEELINDESEINRSKKSTTFCVEIKSGTPECVPCQPVMIAPQPQVVYVTENNTTSDSNTINNTIIQREHEVPLPVEPPCPKNDMYMIFAPQRSEQVVSMVQVPIVHTVPQPPQVVVANQEFIEKNFPELLNETIIPLHSMPAGVQTPTFNPQMMPSNVHQPLDVPVQPSQNVFPVNNNNNAYWNFDVNSRENINMQPIVPSNFELSGSMDNYGVNQAFGVGIGDQAQNQYPSINIQQGQGFPEGLPSQQYFSGFNNNQPGGQVLVNGVVGSLPSQESVNQLRPVNFNGLSQHSYSTSMNVATSPNGIGHYALIPAMINGGPQLCLQPGVINNQQLENSNQQSSMQQENISVMNQQWLPTQVQQQQQQQQYQQQQQQYQQQQQLQNNKKILENIPEIQTMSTVAPVKLSHQSQRDTKGKVGSSSLLLNNLKGPSSLQKSKTYGKGQKDKDNKSNDKSELKKGTKRETEIPVD